MRAPSLRSMIPVVVEGGCLTAAMGLFFSLCDARDGAHEDDSPTGEAGDEKEVVVDVVVVAAAAAELHSQPSALLYLLLVVVLFSSRSGSPPKSLSWKESQSNPRLLPFLWFEEAAAMTVGDNDCILTIVVFPNK